MSDAILTIRVFGVSGTDKELADAQVNNLLDQLSKADTDLVWDNAEWFTVDSFKEDK